MRCCDDAGRVPLHECCRGSPPCLEIALRIFLEDARQAHALDARGGAPLEYAPQEAWGAWYVFLHENKQRTTYDSDTLSTLLLSLLAAY